VSAPEYIFLISQLAGEQRFASTVAKRLESLVSILTDFIVFVIYQQHTGYRYLCRCLASEGIVMLGIKLCVSECVSGTYSLGSEGNALYPVWFLL